MKRLLLIAALAALSNPAFASKARMTALGNASHLVDPQTAFDNPAHLAGMGEYVTMEGGPSAVSPSTVSGTGATWSQVYSSNSPKAEGGFLKAMGDAKLGMYFGRVSAFTDFYRKQLGFLTQENPLEIQYAQKGAINWGAALNYSSSDIKSTQRKQSAMGARFGATTDMWEAFAVVGLGSTADGAIAAEMLKGDADGDNTIDTNETMALAADSKATYKGTLGFKVGAAYKMENKRFGFSLINEGFKYESTANTNGLHGLEVKMSQLDLTALEYNKMDGGQWFYGAGYQMYDSKTSGISGVDEKKITNTYLPFLMGMEFDAASWLVLRASATQNVLIGSTKTDDGNGSGGTNFVDDADTVKNNTKVAAGFGVKMNKWMLDGSWTAATDASGTMNANSLLTNVGLTYNF